MPNLLMPHIPPYYFDLPSNPIFWVGLVLLTGLVGWAAAAWRERDLRISRDTAWMIGGLAAGALLLVPFLGIYIANPGALPPPGRNEMPQGAVLMFFSALPIMLAGGLLGLLPAVGIGVMTGLVFGLLDTHSLLSIPVYAGMALLFSAAVRQRYRTPVFRLLRHPVATALLLAVLYIPVFLLTTVLAVPGEFVSRLDYALSHLRLAALVMGAQLLIGGAAAEALQYGLPKLWGRHDPLQPSPSETKLQLRFLFSMGPVALLLIAFLMVGDWVVAENIARGMMENRLTSTAQVSSESIPYFLETGQNLISQFASDPRMPGASGSELQKLLEQDLRSVPYFSRLALLDASGKPLAFYPAEAALGFKLDPQEVTAVQLAMKGVQVQSYTLPPMQGGETAEVAFLAAVSSPGGQVTRVLWGRTDLSSNPFTQPVIRTLKGMSALGGEGQIVDEDGNILYHPVSARLMDSYLGERYTESKFFNEASPNGTRQMVLYQPVVGRPWAIVLSVPARQVQQLALSMALPLLFMIAVIGLMVVVTLYFGLKMVTASLVGLSGEARRISEGQLDHALVVSADVDEVGQLRRAFEQMRTSLKARLDELNRLLLVSQGVASSLEIQDTIQPILEAMLDNKASTARVILSEDVDIDPIQDTPFRMGLGTAAETYAYLDNEILSLVRQHGTVMIGNLGRGRGLNTNPRLPHPASLAAVALRRENRFYGALWVAYDEPRTFTDEEMRFLNTLAGEAALAATNANLYATAEAGRQRLEAILASSPDPMLVTDHLNHLMLSNPAALQLPGLRDTSADGRPVREAIAQAELSALLTSGGNEPASREIVFSDGRIYYATASAVQINGRALGKVCILRDITHYKELDALKSDFVATVSHDLRSPLTLMRGYATMMQMVGELNDQQKTYVRKILTGVENMSRLVNNLLDLGRIEAGVGLQLEQMQVDEVIEKVTSSLQMQGAQKSIQLSADLSGVAQQAIDADPALLHQALYNLVENAIKYTLNGGQVLVSAQTRPGSVVFSVKDSGIGIAPIDQPRLFEKFYRGGQREAHQQRGSGLGLSIVKSVAERHGGRVWLESQLGKGSVFYLEVPTRQVSGEIRIPVV